MKNTKDIVFSTALVLFFALGILGTSCSKWTQPEANDYFEPPTESYINNMKDYFNSPHKVMFGWFGNWAGEGGSMQYSLMGLPDSVDFVSLWLCWGNLTEAQQKDLKAFQERGSKAILCWLATNIGENITPTVEYAKDTTWNEDRTVVLSVKDTVIQHPDGWKDNEWRYRFWGFNPSDSASCSQAAIKYAKAIVDTCRKYNIDGFDNDIEATGDLINSRWGASTLNVFMRTLREEFDKDGRMLVADIPGGSSWLGYYDMLDDDVVESLDYIVWQTYELGHSGLESFFNGDWSSVRYYKPELFEQVMRKSIPTATFERAVDKHYFLEQAQWVPSFGIPYAGIGAYHIEYDYPGNPDYPDVRKAISIMNPPILK